MIEKNHSELSVAAQCRLLGLSKSSCYYKERKSVKESDVELKAIIQDIYVRIPQYGYRRVAVELRHLGYNVSDKVVRRLMKELGIIAIYPKPNLSKACKEHIKYPYLLRGVEITHPFKAWAMDITYIKLEGGFAYLAAIIDLYSRKILAWRLSNTLDTSFCLMALDEAFDNHGIPEIFNTDQGCQFTSEAFTDELKKHGVQISMDGKGRALDNVYIERFWRTIKYENIHIKGYRTMSELQHGIDEYITFYNSKRWHQSLNYQTPDTVFIAGCRERRWLA